MSLAVKKGQSVTRVVQRMQTVFIFMDPDKSADGHQANLNNHTLDFSFFLVFLSLEALKFCVWHVKL